MIDTKVSLAEWEAYSELYELPDTLEFAFVGAMRELDAEREKRAELRADNKILVKSIRGTEAHKNILFRANEQYSDLLDAEREKATELEKEIIRCREIADRDGRDYTDLTEKVRVAVEALVEYGKHDDQCLAGQWRAGRPTDDGGYETLYGYDKAEKWYPRGETPPCTCGLQDALTKINGDKELAYCSHCDKQVDTYWRGEALMCKKCNITIAM